MRLPTSTILGLLLAITATADPVTYTETSLPGGFFYQFTLTNNGIVPGPWYQLLISIPADISMLDTSSITAPVGWGDSTGGAVFYGPDLFFGGAYLAWQADSSTLYDLGENGTLTGFDFATSTKLDGLIFYDLNGLGPLGIATKNTTSQPPSAVPEPSTAALLIMPILGLIALVISRSKRWPQHLSVGALFISMGAGAAFGQYKVTGYVKDQNQTGIADALVTLQGSTSHSTRTSLTGKFEFTGVPGNAAYTLNVTKGGYFFQGLPIQVKGTDYVLLSDIIGLPGCMNGTCVVTVYAKASTGVPLIGVSARLASSATTTTKLTDIQGAASFSVAQGGSYTVSVSSPSYTFSNSSSTITNISTNTSKTFYADAATATVTGTVNGPTGGLQGIRLQATSSTTATATTTAGGAYSLPGLQVGQTYTVTPQAGQGYSFQPPSIRQNLSATNSSGWNFTASPAKPDVSVEFVSFSNSNPAPGETIAVNYRVRNTGTADSGSFNITVSLLGVAHYPTPNARAIDPVANLKPGDPGSNKTVLLQLPASIPPGGYPVRIIAENSGDLNDTNNRPAADPTLTIRPLLGYGVTVITHGQRIPPIVDTQKSFPSWMLKMANRIVRRAGVGRIRVYDKVSGGLIPPMAWHCDPSGGEPCETVTPDVCIGTQCGELIVLFDWYREAGWIDDGWSEPAADALFAALMTWRRQPSLGDFSRLHLIGHSRGTVVMSEVTERLIATGIPLNDLQVTNLDPHDWGVPPSRFEDLYSSNCHPFASDLNVNPTLHRGTVAWQGISFADTYYQRGNRRTCDDRDQSIVQFVGLLVAGVLSPPLSIAALPPILMTAEFWMATELGGRAVDGSALYELPFQPENSHGYPVRIYTNSIEGPALTSDGRSISGYYLSRVGGGARSGIQSIGSRQQIIHDFFRDGFIWGSGMQGWSEHGGLPNGADQSPGKIMTLGETSADNSKWPSFAKHNRFYLPSGVKNISFDLATSIWRNSTNPGFADQLFLVVSQEPSQVPIIFGSPIPQPASKIDQFKCGDRPLSTHFAIDVNGSFTCSIDVSDFAGTSVSFFLAFLSNGYPTDRDGIVTIQNIRLSSSAGADTRSPILTVAQGSNLSTSRTMVQLNGMVSDDVGVTELSWKNSRGGTGLIPIASAWTSPSISLLPGDNLITVTARDAAGNTATATVTVWSTPPISLQIQTQPAGLAIVLNGVSQRTPFSTSVPYGSTVNLATDATQPGASGQRYQWASWNDGGARQHSFIATPIATSTIALTAFFSTEFQVNTFASPANAGSVLVSPQKTDGWYSSGQLITVRAVPNVNYRFDIWTSGLTGSTDTVSLTLSSPLTIIGSFQQYAGVTVSLSPPITNLGPSQQQTFTPTVIGAADARVTWDISPRVGTITTEGVYTAPASITTDQTATITATSVADPNRKGTATIQLKAQIRPTRVLLLVPNSPDDNVNYFRTMLAKSGFTVTEITPAAASTTDWSRSVIVAAFGTYPSEFLGHSSAIAQAVSQGSWLLADGFGCFILGGAGIGQASMGSWWPMALDKYAWVSPIDSSPLFDGVSAWNPPVAPDRPDQNLSQVLNARNFSRAAYTMPTSGVERTRFWSLGITYGWPYQLTNSTYCQSWGGCAVERSVVESGQETIAYGAGRILPNSGPGVVNGYYEYGPVQDRIFANFIRWAGISSKAFYADQFNDLSANPGWTTMGSGVMYPYRLEQTFVPNASRLTAIDVPILTANRIANGDVLTLRLLDSSGQVIASSSQWVSAGFDGWLRFAFPNGGVSVQPGSTLRIRVEAAVAGDLFGWKYGGNTYPAGQAYFMGSPWLGGAVDFGFRTFSDHVTMNLPPTAGFEMSSGGQTVTDGQNLALSVSAGSTANVSFDARTRSTDVDGQVVSWSWTVDGQSASTQSNFSTSLGVGNHTIALRVADNLGTTSNLAMGTVAVQPVSVTSLLDESFNSLPLTWSLVSGAASANNGILTLTNGCLQLPGPIAGQYSRANGLAIEARIRINWASAGDFNIWGLYDRTAGDCNNGPYNGYWAGWYPVGSDNPNDVLGVVTNGTGVMSPGWGYRATTMQPGQWYTVRQEITATGQLRLYVNGEQRVTYSDSSRQSGFLAIRAWGDVDIDELRVTTLP